MNEKKVVSRKFAIAFGILCIILSASLVGVVINYAQLSKEKDNIITSLNVQITNKDAAISSLQSQLSSKELEISDLQNQISQLENEIALLQSDKNTLEDSLRNLQSKNEDYLKILRLDKYTFLEIDRQINIPAGSGSPTLMYLLPYPGIITISFSATGSVYFVINIYYKGGIYYGDTGNTTEVFPPVNITYRYPENGAYSSGIFSFPAFPPFATFAIGNPSSTSGVSVLITVKYTY